MSPRERAFPMEALERGYFFSEIDGIEPGALYRYRLNGDNEWPDPPLAFSLKACTGRAKWSVSGSLGVIRCGTAFRCVTT